MADGVLIPDANSVAVLWSARPLTQLNGASAIVGALPQIVQRAGITVFNADGVSGYDVRGDQGLPITLVPSMKTPGVIPFRRETVVNGTTNSNRFQVRPGPCKILTCKYSNGHSYAVSVKFYDTVTPPTSGGGAPDPVYTYEQQAGLPSPMDDFTGVGGIIFSNGIYVNILKGWSKTDSTELSSETGGAGVLTLTIAF